MPSENSHICMCSRTGQFAISNDWSGNYVQINGADAAVVTKMTGMTWSTVPSLMVDAHLATTYHTLKIDLKDWFSMSTFRIEVPWKIIKD